MIIEIDRLSEKELKISKNFEFLSTDLVDENAVFRKPVHADISIKRIQDEIFINGQITTQLSFVLLPVSITLRNACGLTV